MKLVLLGPPGVGKGTQAQQMSKTYSIPQISTGDILREAIAKKTPLGDKARAFIVKGELVPDDIMLGLIQDTLFGDNAPKGYILDGFPRTIAQAEGLQKLYEKHSDNLSAVLLLEAEEDQIVARLSARRTCRSCKAVYNLMTMPPKVDGVCDVCAGELYQRDDDRIETIQNRLTVYKKQTAPLIDFYKSRGILKTVDASGTPEEVQTNINRQLED
ncbi:MAG TPA: adenylate kinase [Candidatus Marinimicrobia bacterium]|nr:adenylate kinase [Candidatus Neomarinimicrobiota bacterium]